MKLPEIVDDRSEKGYIIRLGGAAYQIYDAAEMERDLAGKDLGLVWGLSAARGFRIVDQLLVAASSAERIYAVNGGNDLFALFLTPEIHAAIMQHPDASRRHGPYVPSEEYPSFGSFEDE